MDMFVARYQYIADADKIAEHRPQHREFLTSLHNQGLLLASGPLPNTTPAQAVLIFRADSEEHIRTTLAADPFMVNDVVASLDIDQWLPVIGDFAQYVT